MELLKRFWKDEKGLETLEYAIIAAVIIIGLLATLGEVKDKLIALFETIRDALTPPSTT